MMDLILFRFNNLFIISINKFQILEYKFLNVVNKALNLSHQMGLHVLVHKMLIHLNGGSILELNNIKNRIQGLHQIK
jgi:hypothetical protein